jgi:hypothetical protein
MTPLCLGVGRLLAKSSLLAGNSKQMAKSPKTSIKNHKNLATATIASQLLEVCDQITHIGDAPASGSIVTRSGSAN